MVANDSDADEDDMLGSTVLVTAFDAVSVLGAAVDVNPDGMYSYDPASVMQSLAGEAAESMTVVIPYDFSSRAVATLRFAIALGESMPHRIALVHVVPETHGHHKDEKAKEAFDTAEEKLEELVPETMAERMSVEVKAGAEAEGILATAAAESAIFVLMPAQRKSLVKRFLFGSTTRAVLHGSDCPVLFVPPAYELPAQDTA